MPATAVGQPASMLNVPPLSRAWLAPTFDRWLPSIFLALQIPCGSELARESGGSVSLHAECTAAFAGKVQLRL